MGIEPTSSAWKADILADVRCPHILFCRDASSLPIDNAQLEQMISAGFTVGAALAAWWKNNSFTPEAIEADAFMARMKKRVR